MIKKIEKSSDTIDPITEIDSSSISPDVLENPFEIQTVPIHVIQCMSLLRNEGMLDQKEIDVRCIYLTDGKVIFGTLLMETQDSFLVGASATLVMDKSGKISAEPLVPNPVIRLLKTSSRMLTSALPKYRYYYYKYLMDKGTLLLPQYLIGDIMKSVLDFIQMYELNNLKMGSTSDNELEESNPNIADIYERLGVRGVSTEAFEPLVTSEKIH